MATCKLLQTTVKTTLGSVIGFQEARGAAVKYYGVPFAASTAGPNRFLPPQPRAAWDEPLECFTYGDAAPQHLKKSLGQLLGYGNDDVGTIGDDCLNMNIVTPPPPQAPAEAAAAAAAAPPPAAAPVLVWVHGGANANGSNSQLTHLYPSSDFAKRGVVCVSVNYRLAMHGHMHLPKQKVTNLALRDLIASLEWIKTEIAAFGGDPNNVTLWGQSAGAINIAALLKSPKADGLFHKSILVSGGPCTWASETEYATTALEDFKTALLAEAPQLRMHESGEPLLEDLAALPHEVVSKAAARVKDSMEKVHGITTLPALYNAFPDDDVVPKPTTSSSSGSGGEGSSAGRVSTLSSIPLLVGSNAREMSDFARFLGKSLVGRWFGGGLMTFLVKHRMMLAPESTLRLVAGRQRKDGLSDATARSCCDVLAAANDGSVEAVIDLLSTHAEREMAATHQGPVFEFDIHLSRTESPVVGSGHGTDLGLLFMPEKGGAEGGEDPGQASKRYTRACKAFWGSNAMQPGVERVGDELKDAFVRFAAKGTPEHFHDVAWPRNGEMAVTTTPTFTAHDGPFEHFANGIKAERKVVCSVLHNLKP